MRTVTLREHPQGFVAECPSLMGCVTLGRTKAEALRAIRQSIARHTRAARDIGFVPTSCPKCAWVHRPRAAQARRTAWL